MLGILVGEVIYNLRAALDYLIYELAFLDSFKIQEGTQFPIEDTKRRWQVAAFGTKKRPARLVGISGRHKAAIET